MVTYEEAKVSKSRRKTRPEMDEEQLRAWMKLVNTQTLEIILTLSADKPAWYRRLMTEEVQRRRADKGGIRE